MIQPQKVFFMAIDGVAPRAKMNQQRGRRFRSAKEAELSEKRARDRGEELPKDARFDSNCITPGTPFMVRLHEQLKYFVSMKISTDSLWQNVKVILSGHETPGEGEHKIMDFIRYEKSKPDYNPNIRHCLYGLDADLVMLGLCTHDPHFSLLREEVRFGGKKSASKRTVTPENTTFHLLHLSLLREYIDHEFSDLKMRQDLTFDYNVENIIDDWILLGFLVGNDFLPHLPNLHINKGALSDLFTTYKNILPSLGGYMNINGLLNLHRFELFLQALSEKELDHFEDIYSDAKWLEGKTSKKVHGFKNKVVTDTPGPAHVEEMLYENTAAARPSPSLEGEGWEVVSHQHKKDSDFMRLLKSADDFLLDSSDETVDLDSSDTDLSAFDHPSDPNSEPRDSNYHIEFRQHKREYYIRKLGYANVTADVLKEQAYGYVRAIQWNLHYYYNGCMSWSWYYQHHYAPWITDIRGFSDLEIKFEMGKPFLPFEQLLSVLPAASKELLPPLLQGLMINETSPIINYFPKDFESDLNGKQQEWEAVVLIPFIDQCKLQEAVQPLFSHLSKEEQGRNTHGPMLAYTYVSEPLGRYQAPQYFPDIDRNFANCREIWRKEFEVPLNKLNKGLMEGVRLDVYFPGFPTLKHIPHKARLGKENVKVFEQNSRGDNMMLYVRDDGVPDIHQVAEYLQGTEIWVSWPHMVEAKVIGLKNDKFTYTVTRNGSFVCNKNEPYEEENFNSSAKQISEVYKNRWGVVIGKTYIVVEACVMTGRKYVCGRDARITLEKLWSKTPQHFAFQTIRKDILVHDPSFTQYRTLPELFPSGSISYVLANPYYGCEATVLKIDKEHQGRIQLQVLEPIEPTLESVKLQESSEGSRYYPGYKAAQMLGISSHLLSRLTGSLYVLKGPKEAELEHAGRINIGLNLKNNKRNEEVCGFTRKSKDNNWVYSIRTIDVIRSYMGKYPEIFDYFSVADRVNGDHFHHGAIFLEGDGDEKLKELADWIRDLPCSTAGRQPCGTLTLDDAIVRGIEEEVTATHEAAHPKQQIVMQLKPHLIFKPNLSKGGCLPDPDADFLLFDRVVNVREGFSVPLGLRGTVIGLIKGTRSEDSPVEVLFDQEFHGGLNIRCTTGKAYRVPRAALINISYGARKDRHYDSNKEKHPSSSSNRPRAPKPHAAIPADDNNMQARRQRPGESIAYSKILRNSPAKDSTNLMSTAKHVTPPDPKNLPIPSDFLKQTIEDSNIDKDSSSIKKPNSMDMGELWTAVEQFDEQNQSSTNMNQNVANFFASHQQMQETQGGASSSNYGGGGGSSANNFAGSPDKQNPFSGNANNFIPLQVQRSQARGGRGGQRGHGGRGNHQRNVVDSGVVTTGGPNNPSSQHHQPPPPPPQHRGRGRGGRARSRGRGHLAANFTYQPSY